MTENLPAESANPLTAVLADPERLSKIPIETVERLWAMEKDRLDRIARQEFAQAFRDVQKAMQPVIRMGEGQHGAMYARLEHITKMLDPILAEHGFSRSISQADCPTDGLMRFVLTLRHTGGHVETHFMDAPVDDKGSKSPFEGVASAFTRSERHLLAKVCGVQIVNDNDPAIGVSVPISDAQRGELEGLIEKSDVPLQPLLDWLNVEDLGRIPSVQFSWVKQRLVNRGAK